MLAVVCDGLVNVALKGIRTDDAASEKSHIDCCQLKFYSLVCSRIQYIHSEMDFIAEYNFSGTKTNKSNMKTNIFLHMYLFALKCKRFNEV